LKGRGTFCERQQQFEGRDELGEGEWILLSRVEGLEGRGEGMERGGRVSCVRVGCER
jgi:hypothetical protein